MSAAMSATVCCSLSSAGRSAAMMSRSRRNRRRNGVRPAAASRIELPSRSELALQTIQRLLEQFFDNLFGGLLARHHAHTLTRHQRPVLDIALDHRATERASPEMLDLELRRLLIDHAFGKALHNLALKLEKPARAGIVQGADGDDGKARVELYRRHGIARGGAD